MFIDILLGRDEKETFYSSILDRDLRRTYLEALNRASRWLRGFDAICLLLIPLFVFLAPDMVRWPLMFFVIFLVGWVNTASKIRLIRIVNLLQPPTANKK